MFKGATDLWAFFQIMDLFVQGSLKVFSKLSPRLEYVFTFTCSKRDSMKTSDTWP